MPIKLINFEFIYNVLFVLFRLWRAVQAEVQRSLEAKALQQGVRHVLCEVQVCATWHFWEQRTLWQVLH